MAALTICFGSKVYGEVGENVIITAEFTATETAVDGTLEFILKIADYLGNERNYDVTKDYEFADSDGKPLDKSMFFVIEDKEKKGKFHISLKTLDKQAMENIKFRVKVLAINKHNKLIDASSGKAEILINDLVPGTVIKIYNKIGTNVATLQIDSTEKIWNFANNAQKMLASGIYYFKIYKPNKKVETGKIVVVK